MDHSKQLGTERIGKLLLKFSVPAIVGMLVNALYNVVDRIFVGQGVGSIGIAGITIGFPLMMLGMAFGMLIGIGATTLISIRSGSHSRERYEFTHILFSNTYYLRASFIRSITAFFWSQPGSSTICSSIFKHHSLWEYFSINRFRDE